MINNSSGRSVTDVLFPGLSNALSVPSSSGQSVQIHSPTPSLPTSAAYAHAVSHPAMMSPVNRAHQQQPQQQQQQQQQPVDMGYTSLAQIMDQVLKFGPLADQMPRPPAQAGDTLARSTMDYTAVTAGAQVRRSGPQRCPIDGNPVCSPDALMQLYNRSESLLPNGKRTRNILWRMSTRRALNQKRQRARQAMD
ncbi:hypothetical protein EC988_007425, partial [Linderina pennispora]